MSTHDEHSGEHHAERHDAANGAGASADDALLPRLRVIEDQPLAQRADAYVQLHDEMRDRLEGGDAPRTQGH
ncbi:hypothetical protein EV379_2018 [Microterricola gilva]|uniref:Uncharacterized protein n=1 Tax=Microterricola gilva TaxID=393267 RepID=A0A4Q8ANQ6_9MICO|nr:hypothetical protein [Microterricola gilva]RZU65683.1 hypothetical protein EV379_2018 [Microterricola gilva]